MCKKNIHLNHSHLIYLYLVLQLVDCTALAITRPQGPGYAATICADTNAQHSCPTITASVPV